MLKIGQNWSKIANYSPNAQHKSAPLRTAQIIWPCPLQKLNKVLEKVSLLALIALENIDAYYNMD